MLPGAFDDQFGRLPAQPDDKSRVWGANSLVRLPAFGGEVRVELAQQCDYRAPEVAEYETGNRSCVWLAAPDPDAAVTAPGAGAGHGPEANSGSTPLARKNAESLGKFPAERSG